MLHNAIKTVLLALAAALLFSACGARRTAGVLDPQDAEMLSAADNGKFIRFTDSDGETADPQCTTSNYTVALNVFDTLVTIGTGENGSSSIVPSLADSWTVSEDGLRYSFVLHDGVRFSNGALLTSSDVLYSLKRLLTFPDSCNYDIAMPIEGAQALRSGDADVLTGFEIVSDREFTITLSYPYGAFLATLSAPGASIFDEDATERAGERFGKDPDATIGTGPFIFEEWVRGDHMTLVSNHDCWRGAPSAAGLRILFVSDAEEQRMMFERGEIDILDLEGLGGDAEYFIRGADYRNNLICGPRVGITYLALNESVKPLSDVRVRRALQLALDREKLLVANAGGRGYVENGIYPRGLIGYDPDLPVIPYDPGEASRLLAQAGYPRGFELEIAADESASASRQELLGIICEYWRAVGVNATVRTYPEDEFLALRKSGALQCYCSTWSADFNDPDNFIYTFFGNSENSRTRSICYSDEAVMARVRAARAIADEDERLAEYRELQRRIIQEDCAWIPLFSVQHYFVLNDRVSGFTVSWNGWSCNRYERVSVSEE